MINEKYTPEGLPVVNKSVIEVFNRDASKDLNIYGEIPKEDDQSIFSEEINKIANANPELFSHLEKLARGYFNAVRDLIKEHDIRDTLTIASMTGALNCYAALRKQAEANKLEGGFKEWIARDY